MSRTFVTRIVALFSIVFCAGMTNAQESAVGTVGSPADAAAEPEAGKMISIEADGQTWGSFSVMVWANEGAWSVRLERGWLKRGFLPLSSGRDGNAKESSGGSESWVFDRTLCAARTVTLVQMDLRRPRSAGKSWVLLGSCPKKAVSTGRVNDDGLIEIDILILTAEEVAAVR